jgi:hypothetical protein
MVTVCSRQVAVWVRLRSKVEGAIRHCKSMKETHVRPGLIWLNRSCCHAQDRWYTVISACLLWRKNQYDHQEEYWVTIRETGFRKETMSLTERKTEVTDAPRPTT